MNGKDEYVQKLYKLKDQISHAQDYLILEKCTQKVEKIKNKVGEYKNKKQFMTIFDIIELLIKEKTKYFKQKMLKNSKKHIGEMEVQETLKYSRSAQSLAHLNQRHSKGNTTQTFYKHKPLSKKQLNIQVDEKTQIIERKQNKDDFEDKIKKMQSELQQYKDKMKNVIPNETVSTSHSGFSRIFREKQEEIIDEYGKKLRDKTCYIQELKGKIQYLERNNDELKSRVLNQQRRHEDYINDLRNEIKTLKKQTEKTKKQKKELEEQNEDLSERNEGLLTEIKKIASKLQNQIRQKQSIKKNKTAKNEQLTNDLQRQIHHLSGQTLQITKLETQLQAEMEYREQIIQKNNRLQKSHEQLRIQVRKVQEQKQRLQDSLQKMIVQNRLAKQELKSARNAKQLLAQQIIQMKEELIENIRFKECYEHEKEINMKSKLGKLKEIKYLLTQLK